MSIAKETRHVTLVNSALAKGDTPEKLVKQIINTVSNENQDSVQVDLTGLNFFDSIKVGTLLITCQFIEEGIKQISLLVSNDEVKKSIEMFNFSDAIVLTKEPIDPCNVYA